MGYMRHHAIVVASWDGDELQVAHVVAARLFPWVSEISPPGSNGYTSFFVPPDGSKEGWDESDAGDRLRDQFVDYLRTRCYEDGSTSLDWAEVQFGDDNRENLVTRCDADEAVVEALRRKR